MLSDITVALNKVEHDGECLLSLLLRQMRGVEFLENLVGLSPWERFFRMQGFFCGHMECWKLQKGSW